MKFGGLDFSRLSLSPQKGFVPQEIKVYINMKFTWNTTSKSYMMMCMMCCCMSSTGGGAPM